MKLASVLDFGDTFHPSTTISGVAPRVVEVDEGLSSARSGDVILLHSVRQAEIAGSLRSLKFGRPYGLGNWTLTPNP